MGRAACFKENALPDVDFGGVLGVDLVLRHDVVIVAVRRLVFQ